MILYLLSYDNNECNDDNEHKVIGIFSSKYEVCNIKSALEDYFNENNDWKSDNPVKLVDFWLPWNARPTFSIKAMRIGKCDAYDELMKIKRRKNKK